MPTVEVFRRQFDRASPMYSTPDCLRVSPVKQNFLQPGFSNSLQFAFNLLQRQLPR